MSSLRQILAEKMENKNHKWLLKHPVFIKKCSGGIFNKYYKQIFKNFYLLWNVYNLYIGYVIFMKYYFLVFDKYGIKIESILQQIFKQNK